MPSPLAVPSVVPALLHGSSLRASSNRPCSPLTPGLWHVLLLCVLPQIPSPNSYASLQQTTTLAPSSGKPSWVSHGTCTPPSVTATLGLCRLCSVQPVSDRMTLSTGPQGLTDHTLGPSAVPIFHSLCYTCRRNPFPKPGHFHPAAMHSPGDGTRAGNQTWVFVLMVPSSQMET